MAVKVAAVKNGIDSSTPKPDRTVFWNLVDKAAFIDRAVISVYGERKRYPRDTVSTAGGRAIGGPGRKYARAVDGVCRPSDNPFQLVSGLMGPFRRFPYMPAVILKIRSQKTPLSSAQVDLVLSAVMRQRFRAHISEIELTFDISGYSVQFFVNHVQTRAKLFRIFCDNSGAPETFYIGGRKCSWQARVYKKIDDVVRLEFILRRRFLRNLGICQPHELLLLRKFDLCRLVSLRDFDTRKLREVEKDASTTYHERALASLSRIAPPAEVARTLKEQGIVRHDLFVPCELEARLRKMGRKFAW